jgi:GntR family transcriptional regulator / MocR family aminotransferase
MELHVALADRGNLSGQIYRQVREAILSGQLRPGDRLPPSRDLARQLAVARNTVSVAYDRLTGEGFIGSRVGAGTFVSDLVPAAQTEEPPAAGPLRPRAVWARIPAQPDLAAYHPEFDFRSGLPDARLFPYQTWRRLLAREFTPAAIGNGGNTDPAGHPGLRASIARHVGTSRGVQANASDVLVTNGVQQAIDLISRVLLEPGGHVAIEDPVYPVARHLFVSLGARVTSVPIDAEGLVVDALPDDAELVYVTPSHQFPLGMPMSLNRRMALLDWADRRGAVVVEDDYDSEFRFVGRPIDPLQTLDRSGRVLYVGSFSKVLLPTLRLGFVVAPRRLHEALNRAKAVTDWHTSDPPQAALARFIDDGGLARHVRKMNHVYRARFNLLGSLLAEEFAGRLQVVPSVAGLHLCALTPDLSVDETVSVFECAAARGVGLNPLSQYTADPVRKAAQTGFVIGYGAIPIERIEEGLRRFAECLPSGAPTRRPPYGR